MLQALCYSDGNIIISLVNNNVKTNKTIKREIKKIHPNEIVSRYRDPQLQVGENYSHCVKNITK